MFIANNSLPYQGIPLKKPFFAAGPEASPKNLLELQKDVNGAYFTWRKKVDRNKSGTDIDALNIDFRQRASDLLRTIKPENYHPYKAPETIVPRRPASPGVRNGAGSKRELAFNFIYPAPNGPSFNTKDPDTKTILRVQQAVAGFINRVPRLSRQTPDILERKASDHASATSQGQPIYSYLVGKAKDESQVHRTLPPLEELTPPPSTERASTPPKKRKRGANASELGKNTEGTGSHRKKRRSSPTANPSLM